MARNSSWMPLFCLADTMTCIAPTDLAYLVQRGGELCHSVTLYYNDSLDRFLFRYFPILLQIDFVPDDQQHAVHAQDATQLNYPISDLYYSMGKLMDRQ